METTVVGRTRGRPGAGGRGSAVAAGETPEWRLGLRESSRKQQLVGSHGPQEVGPCSRPGKENRKLLPIPESPNLPDDQYHVVRNLDPRFPVLLA